MSNFDDDFPFDDFVDNPSSNDDIVADYDDGEPLELSDAQKDARYEAFMKEVEQKRLMLRKPKDYPAKDRIAAAYWLGEAGEPTAIEELVLVYNRDKTPGMKEAATYALGMFKQLELALDDHEIENETRDILEGIIYHGNFGKRFSIAKFIPRYAGLLGLFIILMVAGVFVGQFSDAAKAEREATDGTATASAPTPTEDALEFAIDDLTTYFGALNDDARVLQGQMAIVMRSESQDCSIEFANPPTYTLSEAWQNEPNLPELTEQLNAIHAQLAPIRDAFLNACSTGLPIERSEGLSLGTDVRDVQIALGEVAEFFGEETGFEAPPTLEFTATPILTPTPEPTVDFAVIRPHYDTLNNIIINLTAGVRGGATRQQIYWQNIIDFGNSEGCEQPSIIVPEDYILPDDVAQQFPDLALAASGVNTGLQLLRESVETFPAACQAISANDVAQVGVSKASLAISALNEAQALLEGIQSNQ